MVKKIIVGDRSIENAGKISDIMNNAGFDAIPFQMDLSSRQSIRDMVAEGKKYGSITMLVNVAGVSPSQSGFRPELATHIDNIDQYDTVFVGYPNWWGDMPMALYSFFDEYDLSGKTVIPFNSHGGSGFSQTVQSIAQLEPDAEVKDGLSVSRSSVATSKDTIAEWIANSGYQKNNKDDSPKNLVVYFSTPEITDASTTASRVTVDGQLYGTTEYMATVIHENTDSDIFKIELAEPYGNDVPDRALNEQENGILPELSSHIENLEQYDTIFVGYPT